VTSLPALFFWILTPSQISSNPSQISSTRPVTSLGAVTGNIELGFGVALSQLLILGSFLGPLLYHSSSSFNDFSLAEPVPESAELTELATVLVPDAPDTPEAAEATVLAPEATELVVEAVVEAASEALESEDATLDMWNYARTLMRSVYDGLQENRGEVEGAGDGRGNEW
jgi:hypothetical protein